MENIKPYGIIYLIKNKLNEKCYIGQTVQALGKRIYRHRYKSNKKIMPISVAIKKYGWNNFETKLLSTCYSLEELNEEEKRMVNEYNTWSPFGYNLRAGNGKGSMSEETKLKISKSNKGKKRDEETKIKLSISHKGFKPTDETRKKLSKINKGKKPHENTMLGASIKNAKTYFLINDKNEKIQITNMKKFCLNNNLDRGYMSNLVTGKRYEYKGYKLFK